jgi:hypothetical protein
MIWCTHEMNDEALGTAAGEQKLGYSLAGGGGTSVE